jgi:hypothetical protein
MNILLLSFFILCSSISLDTITINTKVNNLNFSKDSLLALDVSIINVNKRNLKIRKLTSNYKGEICMTQEWSVIIYHKDSYSNDSIYSPPSALCHLRDEPYIYLKKNDEYRYCLLLNFKYVVKLNDETYHPNCDFGEYKLQLLLKMKDNDVISSNIIKISYSPDVTLHFLSVPNAHFE